MLGVDPLMRKRFCPLRRNCVTNVAPTPASLMAFRGLPAPEEQGKVKGTK